LPNLIIYDPALSVGVSPLYLTIAILLQARKQSQLTPIWPEELDLMIFGCKTDSSLKKKAQE
jgi:hypothetical protein